MDFKWKKRIIHVATAIGISIVVILISLIYIRTLNDAIKENTISEINEITQHDQFALKNYVEYNWETLKRISRRMRRAECETLEDFKALLGHERSETPFLGVYYVDEEYNIYTADYVIKSGYYNSELVEEIVNGQDKFVKHFVFEKPEFTRCRGEQLVYGMTIDYCFSNDENKSPVTLGGKKFKAVLGITSPNALQKGLILDSFKVDGFVNGYSAVINLIGEYIVDPQRTDDENNLSRNFFDELDESVKCSLTSDEARQKMNHWESFTFTRTERVFDASTGKHKDENKFYSCIPIDDQDPVRWYFLFSVNKTVFHERSYSLIILNIIELFVVLSIVLVALFLVIINHYKSANAIEKEKAQSEFLSNMSHEIRTPLNGMVGLNYLIVNAIDEPEKHEEVKEWLKKSHSTAKYLLSLVNDVLDMSKLQAGKVDIVHEPLLIESITDAVWSMQRDNIIRRDIQFVPDIKIIEPCILGDSVRLKQVLVNIVSNAAKFTSPGGKIIVSVRQKYLEGGKVLTSFSCEDTGCGMSQEFLETIFDVFTQERNKNTASIKGTGLGMSISKLLVDAMGGELLVESELGKGSKFTVNLPAEISKMPDYLSQQTAGTDETKASRKKEKPLKILVAEDNELNAEVILEILGSEGFLADHASDGKKTVEMFAASKPHEYDVILMDMRMPLMDGCDASKAIRSLEREDAKTVLIYACTANTFEEDKIRAIESGMNDFLTKPIDVKVLLQMLESVMAHHGN